MVIPTIALRIDPAKMPTLATSNRAPSKARLAINIAMVKPIPAKNPAPVITPHLIPSGSFAIPRRTASQLKRKIPAGFPTKSPSMTAIATGEVKSENEMGTPAFANEKIGIITNPTHGCSSCSNRSRGEIVLRDASYIWRNNV